MNTRLATLFAFSAAFSLNACAQTKDILSVNNQVNLQYISSKVDYTEKDDSGAVLDTENGHVPGFAITASVMRDLWFGNDYLQLSYSRTNGNTNYVGSLISGGNYGSVTATSGATVTDYSLRWGAGFPINPQWLVTPFAEIGHHEWDRGVNAGETYKNSWYGIGAMIQSNVIDKLVVSATGTVGRTSGSSIDVANTNSGFAPSNAFSAGLGDSSFYRLGLSLDYALTDALHANAGVDYRAFNYGRSGNVTTADGVTYYEPKSESKYTTFTVGLGYSFY